MRESPLIFRPSLSSEVREGYRPKGYKEQFPEDQWHDHLCQACSREWKCYDNDCFFTEVFPCESCSNED